MIVSVVQCCVTNKNEYASYSDYSKPLSFTDIVNVLYVTLDYVEHPQLVERIRLCADYDENGHIDWESLDNQTRQEPRIV